MKLKQKSFGIFSVPLFHKSQSNPTTKKEKSGAVAIGLVALSEKSWVPIQLLVGTCPSQICSLLKPSSYKPTLV